MRAAGCIIFLLIVFCSGYVLAQDDDTIQFIHGLPETGEEADVPPVFPDQTNATYLVKITRDKIPSDLLKELKENTLFNGWEKENIYFDRKVRLYRLRIMTDDEIRYYSLNEDGDVISVQERSRSVQDSTKNK